MNGCIRLALFLSLLAAGCSSKSDSGGAKTDDKSKSDDAGHIMDKDEGPPRDRKTPPKDDDKQPPIDNRDAMKIKGDELDGAFRGDSAAASKKYVGKIVEVSSVVKEMGRTATGETFLSLVGTEAPLETKFDCHLIDREPWKTALPDHKVKVRGKCEYLSGELRLRECRIIEAKGETPPKAKSADLEQSYEKDVLSAEKKYADKWIEVTGVVETVEAIDALNTARIKLKATGKIAVSCVLGPGMLRESSGLEGKPVRFMARMKTFKPAEGIELTDGLLFEKP